MQHIERDALAGVQDVARPPSRLWPNGVGAFILFTRHTFLYVIILLIALGLVFLGPVDASDIFSAETQQLLQPYLAQNAQNGIRYSIILMLVLTAVIGFYATARHELSRPQFWMTKCPHCHAGKLRRRRRRISQRVLALLLQLPLFNFSCRRCDWHGSRIDHGWL